MNKVNIFDIEGTEFPAGRRTRVILGDNGAIKGECDLGFYQGVIGDEKARGMTGHYNLIKENEHEAARTERLNLFLSEMR